MTAVQQLAFDFDATPEWVPLVKPTTPNLATLVAEDRCRDCGAKCAFNQGGATPGIGLFMVCDECAKLDRCRLVCCTPVAERRPSRIGLTLDEGAHCDCGWWIWAERWDDDDPKARIPLTPDEVVDLMAEHAEPRHVSRWGKAHLVAEHDELVAARERRRAAYRKRAAA
jgi:hypothetical protein